MITPPVVVAEVEVKDDPNKTLDVLHNDCLDMKGGDSGSFMHEQGMVKIMVVGDMVFLIRRCLVIVERASGGALLFGTSMGLSSACHGSIALQSVGLCFLFGSSGAC